MFRALIGDLFESQRQTLVNTVNCVGIMGKGVALGFKKRWPKMFEDYALRCERGEVRLGQPYLFRDLLGQQIINFPTKDHWRSPSRLRDIEEGLDYLVAHFKEWEVRDIALPPLGCGNGGLEWVEVGPLMYRKLAHLPIQVDVYAPFGTPKQQLGEEFLAAPAQHQLSDQGREQKKLNQGWIVLMEVLRGLESQPYASPVGRTIFQKVCYVVTEMGVDTGFEFKKGSYGPFSEDVRFALNGLANRNWLQERRLGRMLAIHTTAEYEAERRRFLERVAEFEDQIAKTVDLFSRIKSTEQAEEVVTVLFASRQLKKARPSQEISDEQLLDYVLSWKKSWDTEEKKSAIAEAIRNLVVLRWMRLRVSESLMGAA